VGAQVVIVDWSAENVEAAVQKIKAAGSKATSVKADI